MQGFQNACKIVYFVFIKKNIKFVTSKFVTSYHFDSFNIYPLFFLSFFGIFIGYCFKTMFLGVGNNIFYGSIFSISNDLLIETEFLSNKLKLVPFFLVITAFLSFIILYLHDFFYKTYKIHKFFFVLLLFNKRIFYDSSLNLFCNFKLWKIAYKIFYLFDKGLLELSGPRLFSYISYTVGQVIARVYVSGRLYFTTSSVIFPVLLLSFHVYFNGLVSEF